MKKILLAAALSISSSTALFGLDRLPDGALAKIEQEARTHSLPTNQPRMWKIYHDSLWIHVASIFKERFPTQNPENLAKLLFHIRAHADDQFLATDFFRGLESWSEMKPETKNIIITKFQDTYLAIPRASDDLARLIVDLKNAIFEKSELPLPQIYKEQIATIRTKQGEEEVKKYLTCLQSVLSSTNHVIQYLEKVGK